jgi:amino acid transporter
VIGFAIGVAICAAATVAARRWPVIEFALWVSWSAFSAIGALVNFASGDTGWAVYFAALSGLYAYWAWRWWRRRKNRKPSRVLGVVRDLGHRLTVTPVRAPAP